MASLAQIRDFLDSKRIAIAGVSRNPRDFTRLLFREFQNRGYDVVPVNPNAAEVEGIPCAARIADIDPPPEAVLVLTRPDLCGNVAKECAEAGIRKVWIYRRTADPGVISGECPFMFLPKSGGIHWFHGVCRKIVGSYPKA